MKRPTVLAILTILLAGLLLFGLSDTGISVADSDACSDEVTSSMSRVSNSSASAINTITMTGMLNG